MFVFFADLKAAFDKLDRRKSWNYLKEININEKLVRNIEKIYKETKNVIKTKKE